MWNQHDIHCGEVAQSLHLIVSSRINTLILSHHQHSEKTFNYRYCLTVRWVEHEAQFFKVADVTLHLSIKSTRGYKL